MNKKVSTLHNFNLNSNNNFNLNLEKIYYINLDYRVDRRKHMETMLLTLLSKLSFGHNKINKYERFSAFKPNLNDFNNKNTFENFFINKYGVKNNIKNVKVKNELLGIIGCLGSYIQLLEKISKSLLDKTKSDKYIIILEDDAYITNDTILIIEKLFNSENTQFKKLDVDILRINPTYFNNAIKFRAVSQIKTIPNLFKITKNTYYCGGTHINVIPVNKINKILNYLKKSQVMPIDSLFSFNYINSFFYIIENEKSLYEPLQLLYDIPKENKPHHKQLLNFSYNKFR